MKVYVYGEKKAKRTHYFIRLRKEEAEKFLAIAKEWEIEDVDPKGWIILKAKKE